mmetsp:Transcript_5531/g.11344  ORF Transcript_5531/g.11344 Transcript_5531/m.11344 type:complete len:266 (-) Transcript_5531:352-1149(-)
MQKYLSVLVGNNHRSQFTILEILAHVLFQARMMTKVYNRLILVVFVGITIVENLFYTGRCLACFHAKIEDAPRNSGMATYGNILFGAVLKPIDKELTAAIGNRVDLSRFAIFCVLSVVAQHLDVVFPNVVFVKWARLGEIDLRKVLRNFMNGAASVAIKVDSFSNRVIGYNGNARFGLNQRLEGMQCRLNTTCHGRRDDEFRRVEDIVEWATFWRVLDGRSKGAALFNTCRGQTGIDVIAGLGIANIVVTLGVTDPVDLLDFSVP